MGFLRQIISGVDRSSEGHLWAQGIFLPLKRRILSLLIIIYHCQSGIICKTVSEESRGFYSAFKYGNGEQLWKK